MSLLHRFHATVECGENCRTAVCLGNDIDAVAWLSARLRDTLEETSDSDGRKQVHNALSMLEDGDTCDGITVIAVGDVFSITRQGALGHKNCTSVQDWAAMIDATDSDRPRWARWRHDTGNTAHWGKS